MAACGGGAEPGNLSREEVASRLAEVRIEPGLWERSTRVTEVGGEAVPRELIERLRARGATGRHCITPEQAARPDARFLSGREDARCRSRSLDMEGGRMAGEIACVDPRSGGAWTGRFEGRYAPSDYDMQMVMEMPSPYDPGQLSITSRVSGRRLGPCPAAPEGGKSG